VAVAERRRLRVVHTCTEPDLERLVDACLILVRAAAPHTGKLTGTAPGAVPTREAPQIPSYDDVTKERSHC
jgi:hypothetical protein